MTFNAGIAIVVCFSIATGIVSYVLTRKYGR